MPYTCQLQDRPAQPALVVRRRSPVHQLSQVLGPAWGAIMQHAGTHGAVPAGPPFVAYHNTDLQDLDLEIGLPFATVVPGGGEVEAATLPAGTAATCVHEGPYDRIGAAYEALQQWIAAQGKRPAGPAYEFYLNDPRTTAPAALRTEVVWRVSEEAG